jgi:hypothetical protein
MTKIDLGGIATKTDTKRALHPTIAADDETTALLEQWAAVNPQYKMLKNQTETLSRQIAGRIKHLFFKHYNGVGATSSTLLVALTTTTVKLIIKNAYSKKLTDWALLVAAVGKAKAEKFFRYSTTLEFAIDALPEDQQEACANAIIALATEKGWLGAVKATQFIAPRAGFHEARTTALTVVENERLDQVLGITAFPML